jgi:hypothetical protein
VSGPQFLVNAFQASVTGPALPLSDPRWDQIPRVTTSPGGKACVTSRAEYSVERGEVSLVGGTDFLTMPGDTLKIAGLADAVLNPSRPADRLEGDAAVWIGGGEFSTAVIILTSALKKGARSFVDRAALSARTADGEASAKPSTAERRQGLVAALSGLRELLPAAWSATLWAAAAAAPVALLLWVVERAWASAQSARLRRARAALIALFAFMATFAVLPLLVPITHWLLGRFGLIASIGLAGVPLGTRSIDSDLSAPAALCAVLMVLPIMQSVLSPPQRFHHRISGVFAALASVLLLIVALIIAKSIEILPVFTQGARELLDLLPPDLLPADDAVVARAPGSVALLMAFGLWLVLGLCLFWTAVYWVFRTAARNVPVLGAAWVAGLVLFLLPLSFGLSDVAAAVGWVTCSVVPSGDRR